MISIYPGVVLEESLDGDRGTQKGVLAEAVQESLQSHAPLLHKLVTESVQVCYCPSLSKSSHGNTEALFGGKRRQNAVRVFLCQHVLQGRKLAVSSSYRRLLRVYHLCSMVIDGCVMVRTLMA